MKYDRRMYLSLFWILVGAALFVCGAMEWIDSYWSGMGGGFLGVGIVQLARHIRYRKNEEYREKVDVANGDERNRYIAGKAWAWAGYLFVIAAALFSLILQILGEELLSTAAGFAVFLMILLYWGSYFLLRRKCFFVAIFRELSLERKSCWKIVL